MEHVSEVPGLDASAPPWTSQPSLCVTAMFLLDLQVFLDSHAVYKMLLHTPRLLARLASVLTVTTCAPFPASSRPFPCSG